MSQLSSLQAELSRVQARNRELHGYISELRSGINSADRELTQFENNTRNTLSECNSRIYSAHENIIRAHELQLEIDKLYVRFKNMELANKKIRACNNKKYYDFADFGTVRKIVQGMLDNLNLNMISDAIIYKSVEKEHLKIPNYWLTSVLLSIMAWKNDDKELAERAIAISVKLDKKNSSIFYMLFNIRMGREDAALKWFMLYQECELKGSDQATFLLLFSLLSKTIHNNVEDKIKYEITDFINRVIAMNLKSEGYDEASLLETIERYLTRMKGDDALETTMLRRCLTDYGDMADIVALAKNNVNVLQFIMDVANVTDLEKNTFVEQFINDEIAKPNEVELSVYDEIEYNELVIACNGDMEQTNEIYSKRKEKRKKDLNLIMEMIDWIYGRSADEAVNKQVRKNMFTLTKELQKKAVDQYFDHYRNRRKDVHPAVLSEYATDVDFNNREGERKKITTFFESERDRQLSQIKYMIAIAGAVVGVLGLGFATKNTAGIIFALAGVAMVAYNIISNNMQKKHIEETCQLNIKSKNDTMDALFAEYEVYKQVFAEYDAYYDPVKAALDEF